MLNCIRRLLFSWYVSVHCVALSGGFLDIAACISHRAGVCETWTFIGIHCGSVMLWVVARRSARVSSRWL